MIVNFEIDEDVITSAIIDRIKDDWQSVICESVAENFDASDIAEYVSAYNIAREIDWDDVANNLEIDYEQLAEYVAGFANFKAEIAGLLWQQFSDEFGPSMKCVREEIAALNKELEDLSIPFWRKWFKRGNQEEVSTS